MGLEGFAFISKGFTLTGTLMKCLWKLFYYLPKINVLARYSVKKRNAEQHMVMDFVKKMEIAVVNMYCEHDRLQTLHYNF